MTGKILNYNSFLILVVNMYYETLFNKIFSDKLSNFSEIITILSIKISHRIIGLRYFG